MLTAKWLARSDDTNDMQRLSVREEQLRRAVDRELPALRDRVPSDYFLLVLVQGGSTFWPVPLEEMLYQPEH